MIMTNIKESTSISIDANLLSQVREEAKAEHRSLSNYIEMLLHRMGYRPYNEETFLACQEATDGRSAGVVDTSSKESIISSILGDNGQED